MSAIKILLHESIDYAGLFPPAELDMGTALENYARYFDGPTSWALGRFIVPATRLAELELHFGRIAPPAGRSWRLAALLGGDPDSAVPVLKAFNRRHADAGIAIDTVEVKATSESGIGEIARAVPPVFQTYIEIPIDDDPAALVAAIGSGGRRAKVRTGGVTPDAFPEARDLVRFLRATTERGVPFKATAGLHHPLRAEYRLTYAKNSPTGTMFGFLNLMLAAAFLRTGMDDADVEQVLQERETGAIQADGSGIRWRDHRLDSEVLRDARRTGMISFGSCSFTEPVDDLESLHLLQPGVPQL